jgi:hypothetical protein
VILRVILILLVVGVNSLPLKLKDVLPLPGSWDSISRYKMFPLAAGAYSDNPDDCVKNRFKNGLVHKKVKQICGKGYQEPENCFGYTAILNDDKAIAVVFRGTRGFIQLLYEIDRTVFKAKVNTTAGGQVSSYFYSIYQALFDNGLEESLIELSNKYPGYDIWFTGHSLGASLASIAAFEMIAQNKVSANRVKLITFGQPRTGDDTFAAIHDKIVPISYRVTHSSDIVPHLPVEHYANYFHHKSELWYNNDMRTDETYKECDEDESNNCSDGEFWKYSIPAHLTYFTYFVTGYGNNGCA